jgi:uncharacterized protein
MFFDPLYVVVMGTGLALSLGAQAWVKSAVGKWSRVATMRGQTGAEIAQRMLFAHGIQAVRVEPMLFG